MERCISNKSIIEMSVYVPGKTERENTIKEALIEMIKKLFS